MLAIVRIYCRQYCDETVWRSAVKICVAGEGAIARKHLDGIARIDGVEVASLAGGNATDTEELAKNAASPTGRSTWPKAWRSPASKPRS